MVDVAGIQRVLVVDDDVGILRSYQGALQRTFEITALTATSRGSALELARRYKPELAIVDLQLGKDSGLDVLADLRAENPNVTLVLISAYGSVEVTVQAMKAGAQEVLEKPVTPREVFSRLVGERRAKVKTPSADRALWEHVHRVLADCDGNKSEAARRLRKHRSWLKRFLGRHAPKA